MKDVLVRIPDEYNPSDMPVARAQFLGEGYDWGGMMMYIDRVHEMGVRGEGMSIGVIDTGMHKNHPDLDDDVLYRNFTGDKSPQDLSGHGTHVRGIIGMQSNGTGLIGIAPLSKIHIAKSLGGRSGIGTAQELYNAIRWMVRDVKPDWINLSLALGENVQEIYDLLTEAEERGIGVVAASGNMSATKVSFPANHPTVLAVGACDKNDNVASFSNKGKDENELNVVAPGVYVRSTWIDNNYRHSDGTSMACPHVTALCALTTQRLRQLKLDSSPASVRMLVEGFAKDLGDLGKDRNSGHGRVTTEWFGVDTIEDDLENCKDLECMKNDKPIQELRGCLSVFFPKI